MKVSLRTCLMICILSLSQNALAENEFKKIGKALVKALAEPASDTPPTVQAAPAVASSKGDEREYFQKPESNGSLNYEFFVDPRQIFPSVILTALDGAKTAKEKQSKPYQLGDVNGAIELLLQSKNPNQKVKIKTFKNSIISQDTENEVVLTDPNTVYDVSPTIAWDFEKLASLRQPTNETFKFEIQVDGQPSVTKILQPRIRSINDALIAIKSRKGKMVYTAPITFAGYVNENSPIVDQVLKETKELGILAGIAENVTYQNGAQGVKPLMFGTIESGASSPFLQASAIWFYLQSKHYKYSSVTQQSAFNEDVASQSVRSVEDTYSATQANCVDGSVFIASILRKIGIDSYLVLKPGHMYLMFYNDAEKKQPVFIETTMVGNGLAPSLDELQKASKSLFGKGKAAKEFQKSYASFVQANAQANNTWNNDLPNYQKKDPNTGYTLIPIGEMRKLGINPINR